MSQKVKSNFSPGLNHG